jgi:hypothetical protein
MENNTMQSSIELADGFNPFGDDAPQVQTQVKADESPVLDNTNTQVVETQVETNVQVQEPNPVNTFDPNEFVRERFGFESVEEAEEQIKKFKESEKNVNFDFSNDLSRTLFDAIKEGKSDEVYEVLLHQKKIDRLTTSELTPDLAIDIIKTNLQSKYKDLTSEEVDLLFYDNYYFPAKPEKDDYDSDEDYEKKVNTWQSQVDYIEKKMMIDAKVIRPELSKLKQDIVLPDIYGFEQAEVNAKVQKQQLEQARSVYESTLNSEFNSFNGYSVTVKDTEVEMPITFNVAEDERVKMKEILSDFDTENYFDGRWFNEDGKPKVQQIMSDIYLLENFPKILQKVGNEAASQRLAAHLKRSGNISINQPSPQGTPTESANSTMDALANWAFSS